MKLNELERMKGLLTQALGVAINSMSPDRSLAEAKGHIREAINKIDQTAKAQGRKQQAAKSQYGQWWNSVQAGVANMAVANMTPEARQKTLKQLNSLIAQEQQKLAELEKTSDKPAIDDNLLTD